jgi:serine/threonine protein phosphatase 1
VKAALKSLFGRKGEDEGGEAAPRLPQGVRAYAVGDVHGQLHLLDDILSRIDADRQANPADSSVEVFLGDYVDRGPDSAGVIDRLIGRAEEANHPCIFLCGNHEVYVTSFLSDPAILPEWLHNGGMTTLASYGVDAMAPPQDEHAIQEAFRAAFPERHRAFLAGLDLMHRIGDVVFVHAGIRPGVAPEDQAADDLLLIRQEFLRHTKPLPVRVVHGHTPMREPEATPWRVSVDTGAFATGRLTCAVLEDDAVRFLSTAD